MFHDITEKRIGDNSSLIFVSNSIAFQLFRNQTKFTRFNMLRLESLTIRYREIYHRPVYTYTEANRKVRCSNHERHTRETLFLPKNDCIEVERCCEYTTWTYQGPLSDRGWVITSRKKGNARGIKKRAKRKKEETDFRIAMPFHSGRRSLAESGQPRGDPGGWIASQIKSPGLKCRSRCSRSQSVTMQRLCSTPWRTGLHRSGRGQYRWSVRARSTAGSRVDCEFERRTLVTNDPARDKRR